MRSAQRDQGGLTTFGATMYDAASGSGVAQPGSVAFSYTRTATGTYVVRFDTRLTPISVVGNSVLGGYMTQVTAPGPGTFTMNLTTTGFAGANGTTSFTCTARDMR